MTDLEGRVLVGMGVVMGVVFTLVAMLFGAWWLPLLASSVSLALDLRKLLRS